LKAGFENKMNRGSQKKIRECLFPSFFYFCNMIHTKEKVKPPKSLRSARLSVVKNKISTPVSLPTAQKPAAIATPKKVIKALYDYQAQSPHELSFARGDFFHVIGRENDSHWYEACNPVSNSRGVVPVSYFQVLEKNERSSQDAQASITSPPPPPLSTTTTAASAVTFGHQQQQQQQQQPPMKLDSGFGGDDLQQGK
jgi:bud emergence protein 1